MLHFSLFFDDTISNNYLQKFYSLNCFFKPFFFGSYCLNSICIRSNSGTYFAAFRIQPECWEIWTGITPNTDTSRNAFSNVWLIFTYSLFWRWLGLFCYKILWKAFGLFTTAFMFFKKALSGVYIVDVFFNVINFILFSNEFLY